MLCSTVIHMANAGGLFGGFVGGCIANDWRENRGLAEKIMIIAVGILLGGLLSGGITFGLMQIDSMMGAPFTITLVCICIVFASAVRGQTRQ